MANNNVFANVNKIEGFNPMDYIIQLPADGPGEPDKDFLKLEVRQSWFWLMYPQGRIDKVLVSHSKESVIVEARVYADKNDPTDKYIANAFGAATPECNATGSAKSFPGMLLDAESDAIRRALGAAGFNIPPVAKGDGNGNGEPPNVDPSQNNSAGQQPITLEQAKAYKVTTGKNKGKTLGQVAKEKPEDLTYILNNSGKVEPGLLAAAKVLIQHAKG